MPTNGNFNRSPISIVEIVQPFCALTYGSAPCMAALGVTGAYKCYNTYATCQDVINYDQSESVVLRFSEPGARMVDGEYIIPSLQSVSTAPSVINPGVGARNTAAMGQRAVCNIQLTDHPHSDNIVDKYRTERAIDPFAASTFWRKWLARNPYHEGYQVRIYDGYDGEAIAAMQRRDYIIDKIDGPSNGAVKITAKDPLKLADNNRAKAPVASTGTLSAAILAGDTSLAILGAQDGDYPASGTVRVGDECLTYTGMSLNTSTGIITLTGLLRGTDGTTAEGHDEGDTVQLCLRVVNVPAWEVARDLLVDYAGIDASHIPFADWQSECNLYLPSFTVTALITDPVGVNELVGELAQQCLFFIWWDERARQIKLRAVRTYSAPHKSINDNAHIIADSFSIKRNPEERVSQVWIYYDRRDQTKKLDDPSNYRVRLIRVDLDAESDLQYGGAKIKTIFSRWLESGAQAITLGARILSQYRDTPKRITLRLDAKDRDLWTADVVDITSQHIIDPQGAEKKERYQIISAEEILPGEVVEYDLITMRFSGRPGYYMDSGSPAAPTYSSATDEERATGGWYSNDGGTMSDGAPGYTYQ